MSELVHFRQVENHLVVAFAVERLTDPQTISQIEREIVQQLSRLPLRMSVVVDFRVVERTSSQVVGLLLGMRKYITQRFGSLVLCRLNDRLREMLRVMKLDTQFEIADRLRDVVSERRREPMTTIRVGGVGEPQWID